MCVYIFHVHLMLLRSLFMSLWDEWEQGSEWTGSSPLNDNTGKQCAIRMKAVTVLAKWVIKKMCETQRFQAVQTDRRKAKPMPNSTGGFTNFQGFSGQLPKDRANQVMPKLITTIQAPKDARMNNGLMHARRCCPSSSDGFKPTDTKKNVAILKRFLN